MKHILAFFIFILFASNEKSQNYTASQILIKADSVLNSHYGKHLIEYSSLDKDSRLAKADSVDVISSHFWQIRSYICFKSS
jgi:hypothetical protein